MAEAYDTSDEALYRLVDTDELDALLAAGARPVARDTARTVHLLTRVRTTLEAHRVTILGLQKHIAQVQEHLSRVGAATTLNPMDALRYLDDDQRELLFDRIARDRLGMLRHMVDQANATREHLLGELEQVRGAANAMAQRPDLPPDVRAEFTKLLAYLPSDVREVHRPPLLDFPDPDAPTEAGPPAPRRRTGTVPPAAWNPAEHDATTPAAGPSPAPAAAPVPTYVDPYAPAVTADAEAPAPVYTDPYAAAPDTGPVYVDPFQPRATDPDPGPGPDAGADLSGLFD